MTKNLAGDVLAVEPPIPNERELHKITRGSSSRRRKASRKRKAATPPSANPSATAPPLPTTGWVPLFASETTRMKQRPGADPQPLPPDVVVTEDSIDDGPLDTDAEAAGHQA